MAQGWVRAWDKDFQLFQTTRASKGYSAAKRAQAFFRKDFTTSLKDAPNDTANTIDTLRWSAPVDLPNGLGDGKWTAVIASGDPGFIKTAHLAEIAYVRLKGEDEVSKREQEKRFKAELRRSNGEDADLLWGDLVQIIQHKDNGVARVKARGLHGEINADDITGEPLLEVYFIDVGQGDGVLIRYPDGKHMMIDGGLERSQQMTGKNAADFVDWKFFADYGEWRITIDDMIASHSDTDHFGGLHDLIEKDAIALDELDCLEVGVGRFGHPGLSRFPKSIHNDKLGPREGPARGKGFFTRLMGDRTDAQGLVDGDGANGLKLSGPWRSFIKAVLENDAATTFERIGVDSADAQNGDLPVYDSTADYSIKVLAPVTVDKPAGPALLDLGDTGKNSNGHSACLRIDYKNARILMTGDLNTKAMHWLAENFDGHMDEWECDVAKACHHGSDDISFKFLKAIKAAATVISSGDNEGHAHPRPEIVAASAMSGHEQLSDDEDRVITPLVYMTEIERSVMLSTVNRIEVDNLGAANANATILAKPLREYSGREWIDKQAWDALDALPDNLTKAERKSRVEDIIDEGADRVEPRLEQLEIDEAQFRTRATLYGRRPTGAVGVTYPLKPVWRSRVMEKNVYGLVNVRTDGDTMMCASKRDDGERWTIHHFKARFTN
ncbi:MAG: MBL fold metallo-hydrolase [Pseudomonadota bacterium]